MNKEKGAGEMGRGSWVRVRYAVNQSVVLWRRVEASRS